MRPGRGNGFVVPLFRVVAQWDRGTALGSDSPMRELVDWLNGTGPINSSEMRVLAVVLATVWGTALTVGWAIAVKHVPDMSDPDGDES
jgi:hypothetical protein